MKDSVTIDGGECVLTTAVTNTEGLPLVCIRSVHAGVHVGYLKTRESTLAGCEVELLQSRRIFYWSGAASLSQLATDGVSNPTACKFPCAINHHHIFGVIEIIPVTHKAKASIDAVPIWKK